jgi:hypothetical protein
MAHKEKENKGERERERRERERERGIFPATANMCYVYVMRN